jgi:transposase InsO family protein
VLAGNVDVYKSKVAAKNLRTGRARIVIDVVGEKQSGEAVVVSRGSVLASFEAWRHHYNRNRPRSSLRNLTPHEFARQGQVVRNNEGGALWL